MSTPVKPKSTPSKEKAPKGTPKGTPRKEKLFAGLTTTENNLIILANYYLESEGGKIDWELVAQQAGVKSNSARTLYRSAKRKVEQYLADVKESEDAKGADADVSSNGGSEVKKGKSRAKVNNGSPKAKKAKLANAQPVAPVESPVQASDAGDSGIEDADPFVSPGSQESGIDNAERAIKTESEEGEFYLDRKYPGEPNKEAAAKLLEKAFKAELPDEGLNTELPAKGFRAKLPAEASPAEALPTKASKAKKYVDDHPAKLFREALALSLGDTDAEEEEEEEEEE